MSGAVSPTSTEHELIRLLEGTRVVPVTNLDDGDQAEATGRALVRGGIRCIEITFRTTAAAEAIRRARQVEGLLVGAGTVLSPEQVAEAVDAGAQFAVAPGTSEEVVRACQDVGLPFIPGVATASEIERGRRLGLRVFKVFPAREVGGPAYLKAMSAPYPDVRFVPTGGVEPGNLAEYLAVPSVLAVGGSWLVKPDLLRAGRFDEVERLAREAVQAAA